MNPSRLEELARDWRRQLTARDLLFATGAACLAGAMAALWADEALLAGGLSFAMILVGRLALSQPWKFDAERLSRHLNRTYPELEESSALWLRAREGLTTLERMQLARAESALAGLEMSLTSPSTFAAPPRTFLRAAWGWLIISTIFLIGTAAWLHHQGEQPRSRRSVSAASPHHEAHTPGELATDSVASPRIVRAELLVDPPPYTGRPPWRVSGFNAEIEEGAQTTWRLTLDKPLRELRFIFGENGKDFVGFVATAENQYEARNVMRETVLGHLTGTLTNGTVWNPPELYSLKVRRDQAPVIRIAQPASARTELLPSSPDSMKIPQAAIEVLVNDDYAVAEAHLVATVAKGTGEAVKFREQNLPFDAESSDEPGIASPAAQRYSKTLDLRALGLEPGDELYFYVEASDNRQPSANRVRSETRFISLKGPEAQAAAAGRGVAGVNLIPQYFRSQRQIIIDTEKLIADRPTLTDPEFRQRANDLGIDQQLLRLRYGQFLGEELEQGQGAGDHQEISLNPLQRGITAGVPSDLVHQHDAAPAAAADPRAGARTALRLKLEHEEQARQGSHEHEGPGAPSAGATPTAEQIVAPFVDQHDKQDEATFFDHDTKSTLRDALAAMWEAEGFLRTARPEEALKPENTALTILKDIQQSARAYVQRVGFEPSPLRENERRLKGDVADFRNWNVTAYTAPVEEAAIAQVRVALQEVSGHGSARRFSSEEQEILRRLEPALTQAATRQPEIFLNGLRALREALADRNAPLTQDEFTVLEQALFRMLPPAEIRPMPPNEPAPALATKYFKALIQLERKP